MAKPTKKSEKSKSNSRTIKKTHGKAPYGYLPWFVVREVPSHGIAWLK